MSHCTFASVVHVSWFLASLSPEHSMSMNLGTSATMSSMHWPRGGLPCQVSTLMLSR